MGLLDLFSQKGAIKKHGARVADKRAQALDRLDSIKWLAKHPGEDTAAALLRRFTFRVDPSITDQDEKDLAFDSIVAMGELAVAPTRAFLRNAESVSWPVKILERLVGQATAVGDLLDVVASLTTDYERDPERKIQVIAYLEDRQDPRIADAVVRFFDDVNETTRCHAVAALMAQPEAPAHRGRVLDLLARDGSVRVKTAALDALAMAGWPLTSEEQASVRDKVPAGWRIGPDGRVARAPS